jgi:RHS repeat-associated protein
MCQTYLKYNAKTPPKPPRTFTGKERDSETGFSYFGARYYDSDLMTGWLSVDPMADKYPGLSPYAYCAWNPVRLVDPDGEEIWITGSNRNEYQYREGKLYNKDGTKYVGNDKFATRVQKDLNILKRKGMSEQINSLEKSSNKHTIKLSGNKNSIDPGAENEKNISNGIGCGTTIGYNPNLTEIEEWVRPAVVGLAHEIQHAYEMDKGIYNKNTVTCRLIDISCNIWDSGVKKITFDLPYGNQFDFYYKVIKEKEIEKGEFSAIRTANGVYSALGGKKPRKTYDGLPIKKFVK